MFSWESFRASRARRAGRRIGPAAPERLEGRELMAYTSLGFSLADLAITGESAPATQWGGTLTLDVTLQNLGASTITEPTALTPPFQVGVSPDGTVNPPYYTPSQADAVDTTIAVYIVPRGRGLASGVQVGTIDAPAVGQNSLQQFQATVTLPSRPAGFAGSGPFTVRLVANSGRNVLESNYRNNVSPPMLVNLTPVPGESMLRAVAFDLPAAGLSPGDVIAPQIQIANLGAAAVTSDVEVAVVASTSPDFNLGSSIVATYTISGGIDGVNSTPLPNGARYRGARWLRNNIITPRNNVVTINGTNATLPVEPATYYIGIVIDPNDKLNLPNRAANRLELVKVVSTAGRNTATGVVGSAATFPFEYPPDGVPVGVTY